MKTLKLPIVTYINKSRIFGAGLMVVTRQEQPEVLYLQKQDMFSREAVERLMKLQRRER